jgi:hypothetical protein
MHTWFWWGDLRLGALGRSRWNNNIKIDLKKRDGAYGLDSSSSGKVVGSPESSSEPLGSIKYGVIHH